MVRLQKLALAAAVVSAMAFDLGDGREAAAAPVTINFTGITSSVPASLASQFTVGGTLTGTITYEQTTAGVGDANTAVFLALISVSFTLEGYSASSSGAPEVQMGNQGGGEISDRFATVSRASDGLTGPDVNGLPLSAFGIRLDDLTGTVFSSALTLPTSLSLADFDIVGFLLFFDDQLVFGTLTSLTTTTAAAVPEPLTLALVGTGLIGVGVAVRRRRQQ